MWVSGGSPLRAGRGDSASSIRRLAPRPVCDLLLFRSVDRPVTMSVRQQQGAAVRRFARVVAVVLGVVIIEEVVESVLMMWAFRSGNPRAMRLLTSYHKNVTNPVMVRFFAGRSAHSALLHHVGRRSGKAYMTPLTAHRSQDTIIVPLPYGTEVDWLRNLQAAGQGVVELDGRRVAVDEPDVLPVAEVMPLLPSFVARLVRLHSTQRALRLHVAGPAEGVSARPRPSRQSRWIGPRATQHDNEATLAE